jgi:hypothetical protein
LTLNARKSFQIIPSRLAQAVRIAIRLRPVQHSPAQAEEADNADDLPVARPCHGGMDMKWVP